MYITLHWLHSEWNIALSFKQELERVRWECRIDCKTQITINRRSFLKGLSSMTCWMPTIIMFPAGLYSAGTDVNAVDKTGLTPLAWAAAHRQVISWEIKHSIKLWFRVAQLYNVTVVESNYICAAQEWCRCHIMQSNWRDGTLICCLSGPTGCCWAAFGVWSWSRYCKCGLC